MDDQEYQEFMEPAFIKVGRYFSEFGLMELALNDCIGKGVGVNEDQSALIGKLLSIGQKTKLMKEILVAQDHSKEWRNERLSIIVKVEKAANERNIVAHNVFTPLGKGIIFSNRNLRKTTGESLVNSIIWKENEYWSKIQKLERLYSKLEKLAQDLVPVHVFSMTLMEPFDSSAMVAVSPAPSASTAIMSVSSPSPDDDA